MKLQAQNISKYFGEKMIFEDINFELSGGQSAAIIGPNGSGKTTLVKIICNLIRPTKGNIVYSVNDTPVGMDNIYKNIGLVSPYLELYEDLTARENLLFFAKLKKVTEAQNRISELMSQLNLSGRENDQVKTYSSGMRQRLKYVFALLDKPRVLILDEPTSNLDTDGTDRVYQIMEEQKKKNILILATNDSNDLKYGDFQVAVVS